VLFNNKVVFSKLKNKNWPNPGQITDLIQKEINRVENCIPDEDKLSQSFIRKRASKNPDELSRPTSSYDSRIRDKKALKNNYPSLSSVKKDDVKASTNSLDEKAKFRPQSSPQRVLKKDREKDRYNNTNLNDEQNSHDNDSLVYNNKNNNKNEEMMLNNLVNQNQSINSDVKNSNKKNNNTNENNSKKESSPNRLLKHHMNQQDQI